MDSTLRYELLVGNSTKLSQNLERNLEFWTTQERWSVPYLNLNSTKCRWAKQYGENRLSSEDALRWRFRLVFRGNKLNQLLLLDTLTTSFKASRILGYHSQLSEFHFQSHCWVNSVLTNTTKKDHRSHILSPICMKCLSIWNRITSRCSTQRLP